MQAENSFQFRALDTRGELRLRPSVERGKKHLQKVPQERKFGSDDAKVAAAQQQQARDAVEIVLSAVFVMSGGPQ